MQQAFHTYHVWRVPPRHPLPMALVPHTTPASGHIFVATHMRVAVLPNFPIKEVVLAKLVSQSLASESTTPQGS